MRRIIFALSLVLVLLVTACDASKTQKLETQVTELQNQVNTLTVERDAYKAQVDDLVVVSKYMIAEVGWQA